MVCRKHTIDILLLYFYCGWMLNETNGNGKWSAYEHWHKSCKMSFFSTRSMHHHRSYRGIFQHNQIISSSIMKLLRIEKILRWSWIFRSYFISFNFCSSVSRWASWLLSRQLNWMQIFKKTFRQNEINQRMSKEERRFDIAVQRLTIKSNENLVDCCNKFKWNFCTIQRITAIAGC